MAAARRRGAGWVLVRPLRPPAPGTSTRPLTIQPRPVPSSPSMIFRRSPASSSFVLAAARLRALQLDPWPRGSRTRQLRGRIQKNSQPSPAARVVTGPGSYALLTLVALMGAAYRGVRATTDYWGTSAAWRIRRMGSSLAGGALGCSARLRADRCRVCGVRRGDHLSAGLSSMSPPTARNTVRPRAQYS